MKRIKFHQNGKEQPKASSRLVNAAEGTAYILTPRLCQTYTSPIEKDYVGWIFYTAGRGRGKAERCEREQVKREKMNQSEGPEKDKRFALPVK